MPIEKGLAVFDVRSLAVDNTEAVGNAVVRIVECVVVVAEVVEDKATAEETRPVHVNTDDDAATNWPFCAQIVGELGAEQEVQKRQSGSDLIHGPCVMTSTCRKRHNPNDMRMEYCRYANAHALACSIFWRNVCRTLVPNRRSPSTLVSAFQWAA